MEYSYSFRRYAKLEAPRELLLKLNGEKKIFEQKLGIFKRKQINKLISVDSYIFFQRKLCSILKYSKIQSILIVFIDQRHETPAKTLNSKLG